MPTAEPRFERLMALFDAAMELPPASREAFLACITGPPDLVEELRRLVQRHDSHDLLADAPLVPAFVPAPDTPPPVPLRAGPFRLMEALGDGGMGRVFRGVRDDGEVEQEVAIKLVRGELLNPALLTRFSNERRLLAALEHPHICRFLDAGTLPDGTPYVAMERIQGEPLFEYCDRRNLALPARLRLLRKIAAAVGYAHRQLIVHRDIKSSNVLVDAGGDPHLLDFGIAKSLASGDARDCTATAERFVTPSTAAPEQLRGEATGVGCDIHALGLLAYELLSGRPAFDLGGLRAGEIEHLVLRVPPPLMSQRALAAGEVAARARGYPDARSLARTLAGDLDAVVATCLRKAVHERYPSVEQLDAEIGRWLDRRPVRARGGERGYRLRKYVERNRLALGMAASIALVLLVAVAIVVRQSWRLAEERNRVVQERDRAQQVIALLQGAFIGADPARAGDGEVSAREILAAARPRVEVLFEPQPGLYAVLAATLAEVEQGLGLDADAERLARRGIEATARAEVPLGTRRVLHRVAAEAATSLGQFADAREALDTLARLDPARAPDWLVADARLWRRLSDFDAARRSLEQALATLATRDAHDELATQARWERVQVLRQQGEIGAALAALEDTLRWQQAVLDEDHPRVVLTRLQRVDLLRQDGQAEAAVAEGERVHRGVLTTYGRGSVMAARSGAALGMAQFLAGRSAAGIETYDQARASWVLARGEQHPQSVRASFNLARMLERAPGRDDEARAMYERALDGAQRQPHDAPNSAMYMRLGLARWLAQRGEWKEVLAVLTAPQARIGLDQIDQANLDEYVDRLREARGAGCRGDRPIAACEVAAEVVARIAAARDGP